MRVINEIQADEASQDVPFEWIEAMLNLGVLFHVQTSVYNTHIHRYFVPLDGFHEYRVEDFRVNPTETFPEKHVAQVV